MIMKKIIALLSIIFLFPFSAHAQSSIFTSPVFYAGIGETHYTLNLPYAVDTNSILVRSFPQDLDIAVDLELNPLSDDATYCYASFNGNTPPNALSGGSFQLVNAGNYDVLITNSNDYPVEFYFSGTRQDASGIPITYGLSPIIASVSDVVSTTSNLWVLAIAIPVSFFVINEIIEIFLKRKKQSK